MIDWEALKAIWPIGLLIGGQVVRTEVTQALNKHKIAVLEAKQTEDKASTHKRIDDFERRMGKTIDEIHSDIKELLRRGA